MVYIIHKTKFEKFEPKKLIYRNFKQYDSGQLKLDNCNSMSAMRTHAAFENIFFSILDKQKFYEGIKNSILIRIFRSKYWSDRVSKTRQISQKNPSDIFVFKWQQDLLANLNKCTKSQYFEKLSVDWNSNPFWKACKPYFSNKNSNIPENIMLLEKDKWLSKQKDVTATFNKHFGSITNWLNLFSWSKEIALSLLKNLPFTDV